MSELENGGFKETRLGKIPEDWNVKKFQDLGEFQYGYTCSATTKDTGIRLVRITDIKENGFIVWDNVPFAEVNKEDIDRYKVKEHDLLFARIGATTGKVGFIKRKFKDVIFASYLIRFTVERSALPVYIFYYTQTALYNKFVYINKEGKLKKGLNSQELKSFEVPIPNIREQQKIVSILSNMDDLILQTEEIIYILHTLKKGLMQRLFTEGIGHTEFKETRLGTIPKEWEIKKLGDLINIYDSERIPLSQTERNERKGNYPYCGATGIIDYIDDYLFDGEYVLLAEDGGPFGKFENSAYIMSGKFWVNNHAHVIQAIQGQTTNLYLLYVLNYLSLIPYIVGSTRQKLNQGDLKKIKIPVPNLEEQESIIKIFSNLDNKIVNENQSMSILKEIKKGLMQDLLTGKKRIH